jgi:hypothetical protein
MRFAASLFAGLVLATAAFPASAATFDLKCMQNAVEKRESSYIIAFDTYYATVRSAMIIRKDAIRTAWGIADKSSRQSLLGTAAKNFKTSEKAARKSRTDAEKNATRIFKSDAELCEIDS